MCYSRFQILLLWEKALVQYLPRISMMICQTWFVILSDNGWDNHKLIDCCYVFFKKTCYNLVWDVKKMYAFLNFRYMLMSSKFRNEEFMFHIRPPDVFLSLPRKPADCNCWKLIVYCKNYSYQNSVTDLGNAMKQK